MYVNGAPQGLTFHETEDYTIYPAPILSVTRQRFTKHYFIGDRRIASKIGAGIFQNAYGHGANIVTAGQKDYQMRMMQIERQREDYYRKLGTPPGVPTMKGATAEPENTHEGYNTIIKELGDHSVPDGWIQRPKRNAVPGTPPGPPVQWDKAEDPDDVQPGYGYVPADTAHHEDIFFYHSDHLGSTSYITDAKANVAQFDAHLPYGELLVDEHSSSEEMPYKFNGKEFDEETGLYYYGARYMNPKTSLWYGVDPLAEKRPNIIGYNYCLNNPIKLIDPDGRDSYYTKDGTYVFTNTARTDNIYIISNYKIIGGSRNKVYYKVWGRIKIDDKNLSISPQAYSRVYTNVLYRKGYDISKLKNNAVSIIMLNNNSKSDGPQYELGGTYNHDAVIPWSDAPIAETRKEDGKIQLTVYVHPQGDAGIRAYLSTESNVVNILGVHEFKGHGLLGIGTTQHWKILQMQRRHPSWKQTTPHLKELYEYLEKNMPSEHYKR